MNSNNKQPREPTVGELSNARIHIEFLINAGYMDPSRREQAILKCARTNTPNYLDNYPDPIRENDV